MVGAISIIGSVVVDSQISHSALPLSKSTFRSRCGNSSRYTKRPERSPPSDLSISFVNACQDWRLSSSRVRRQRKLRNLVIVDELGGQYEDTFADVTLQIINYFTIKAVRTVLHQLYEMNPPTYRWFYEFVATHSLGDGDRFIKTLVKERQELAERVMITRLHLYSKWIKKCDHAKIYQQISDQNLELMRERLMETVVWPSDDTNTEKIG